MLQSVEIEIKMLETRTELRALQAGPPADDATEEVRAAFDVKLSDGMKSLDDLETQKRTALKAEEVAQERALKLVNVEQRVGAGDLPNMPPEFREFMGIEARCNLEGFFDGIHDNIETVGAEREMRQALGMNERGVIPWPMLIEPRRLQEIRQEQRAALAEGAKVRAIIGKEFADKIGEGNDVFLRAAFGSRVDRHVDAGPGHRGRVCGLDSGLPDDAVLICPCRRCAGAGADLDRCWYHGRPDGPRGGRFAGCPDADSQGHPCGLRHQQDRPPTIQGLESSLRADLPRAINDVMDFNVLQGSSFSGSILARTTNPMDPSAIVTFGSGIASLAAAIDGKHARTLKECKLVVNPDTIRVMYSLLASNTAVTLPDYYMMNSGGLMTTSNMPATASMIAKAIACKTGPGVMYNGIAKMWGGGIQVIRDEYSKAPENQLIITANVYADYDVVRPAGYLQIEFKTS